MKRVPLIEELERETEELKKLADEAMKRGVPLTQDEKFMEQNQKVDKLVVKIQSFVTITE